MDLLLQDAPIPLAKAAALVGWSEVRSADLRQRAHPHSCGCTAELSANRFRRLRLHGSHRCVPIFRNAPLDPCRSRACDVQQSRFGCRLGDCDFHFLRCHCSFAGQARRLPRLSRRRSEVRVTDPAASVHSGFRCRHRVPASRVDRAGT